MTEEPSSRRKVLKSAMIGALATAVGALALDRLSVKPAKAATGDAWLLGNTLSANNGDITGVIQSSASETLLAWNNGTGPAFHALTNGGPGIVIATDVSHPGIDFGTAGVAPPGAVSAGQKIRLWGSGAVAAAQYALGIEGNHMWFSHDQTGTNSGYKFYNGGGFVNFFIGGSGLVGIRTTSPTDLLHVVAPPGLDANIRFEGSGNVTGFVLVNTGVGGGDWRVRVNKNTIVPFGGLVFQKTTSAFPNMVIDGSGNVGIGTSTPSPLLHVNGPVNATAFNNISDLRLKHDVAPLTDVLERLEQVSGVSFQWKHSDSSVNVPSGRQIGLIAQEVEAAFPELVSKWAADGAEDYRGVDYGRFTAVLVEAVRELHKQNKELRSRLERLEQAQNAGIASMLADHT